MTAEEDPTVDNKYEIFEIIEPITDNEEQLYLANLAGRRREHRAQPDEKHHCQEAWRVQGATEHDARADRSRAEENSPAE